MICLCSFQATVPTPEGTPASSVARYSQANHPCQEWCLLSAASPSVFAAMMKSFRWRPRVLWGHQVTVIQCTSSLGPLSLEEAEQIIRSFQGSPWETGVGRCRDEDASPGKRRAFVESQLTSSLVPLQRVAGPRSFTVSPVRTFAPFSSL
jgi:hypothetical protein